MFIGRLGTKSLSYLFHISGANWLVWDPCGLIFAVITWFLIFWANYRVIHLLEFVVYDDDGSTTTLRPNNLAGQIELEPRAYTYSHWDIFHGIVFQTLILLAWLSHFRAMTTNPGLVPLRTSKEPMKSISRSRPEWVDGELVTNCWKCDSYKPHKAHHCSTCNRCIRDMDHHCPWVNNCVGTGNHKYFILFTSYIFVASIYAAFVVGRHIFHCTRDHWKGVCTVDGVWGPVSTMLLCMEIFMFGMFTLIMTCDQACSVAYDTSTIEKLKGENDDEASNKSCKSNFVRICGDVSITWLLPVVMPKMRHRLQEI
eukprot:m.115480 g.115480  ORF g.115480 m.115480 type:complete len:312 (+) comp28425_c0_seq2:232-1167(+)